VTKRGTQRRTAVLNGVVGKPLAFILPQPQTDLFSRHSDTFLLVYCFSVSLATTLKSLLFLPENGTALQVRRGSLCVRNQDATTTLYPPRVHGLRTIILAGHGVSLTSEAIRWASREGAALYLMNLSGEAFAVIGETVETDHRRLALASTPTAIRGCR
jgi:hypothetical protein